MSLFSKLFPKKYDESEQLRLQEARKQKIREERKRKKEAYNERMRCFSFRRRKTSTYIGFGITRIRTKVGNHFCYSFETK